MGTPQAHALLGASSAHRWLTCPPSARLEEAQGEPDTGSDFAEEGTAAHEYAELLLSNRLGEINNRSFANRMKKIKAGKWWGTEMEEVISDYANFVMESVETLKAEGLEPYVDLEQKVDYTEYVPDGFGTADVVIIADRVLWVIDLKYGKGVPVSAQANPQLRLYGLGAALKYRMLFDFEEVHMTIVQPRLGSTSTDKMSYEDLLLWANEIVHPAAELAYVGGGEFHPTESACRWCRAKAVCRARADAALAEVIKDFDDEGKDKGSGGCSAACPPTPDDIKERSPLPEMMTTDEVAALLPVLPLIQAWAKDVEDWALEQARDHGVHFEGYKLVEGRSVRKIIDENAAAEALDAAGYYASIVYKAPELKTITQLEKLLGKKEFDEILGGLVNKPAGKPTLVPVSDKRPEIGSAEGARADFEEAA